MFEDDPKQKRGDLAIPCNYPTNPQAEVLVFSTVLSQYLEKVYFENQKSLDGFCQEFPGYGKKVCVSDVHFKPRADWQFWSKN